MQKRIQKLSGARPHEPAGHGMSNAKYLKVERENCGSVALFAGGIFQSCKLFRLIAVVFIAVYKLF